MRNYILVSLLMSVQACGGGSDSNDSSRDIVGNNAILYNELQEVDNSISTSPEPTGYVLDANGIKISGVFESSAPSFDYYVFYTADNAGVDIQVFVDGSPVDASSTLIGTSLDAYSDDGLSALTGLNYATNAWVAANSFFVISVVPIDAAGKSYTIQMRSAQ